jgi:DNA-directed RNA polymerase subunit beta'
VVNEGPDRGRHADGQDAAQESKTKDITGGLPRVAELFEARRPKDAAEISKIDGWWISAQRARQALHLIKDPQTGLEEEHLIPIGKHVIVFKGDYVKKGQQLTEGPVVPHEILDVCGPQELQEHLVNEVQEVYRLQGVTINDKHIEIIVRQMLRKVRITEPGDTTFLWGEQVDKLEFEEENERVEKMGGKPAEASAGAAGHHQGLAGNRELPQRRLLPGHHPGADRGGHAWARWITCAGSRKT